MGGWPTSDEQTTSATMICPFDTLSVLQFNPSHLSEILTPSSADAGDRHTLQLGNKPKYKDLFVIHYFICANS